MPVSAFTLPTAFVDLHGFHKGEQINFASAVCSLDFLLGMTALGTKMEKTTLNVLRNSLLRSPGITGKS